MKLNKKQIIIITLLTICTAILLYVVIDNIIAFTQNIADINKSIESLNNISILPEVKQEILKLEAQKTSDTIKFIVDIFASLFTYGTILWLSFTNFKIEKKSRSAKK